MAGKLKLLVFIGVFLAADVVFAQEELTEADQTKTCLYLNSVRTNFTACCEYPAAVMWQWQLDICNEECGWTEENAEEYKVACCVFVCAFYMLKIVSSKTETTRLETAGFINSFMLSIGNETIWEPVITGAVNRCYTQYLDDDMGYDCDIVPKSMYSIIGCTYLECYLKCPKWNPEGHHECVYTAEYARKCVPPTLPGE